jgi:diguanylate cyclase (GGDEF)-like protein/putative nucleotidyltransferase with HDIG domain
MLKTNWKSTALLAGISVVSVLLLLSAVVATIDLALFTNVGIGSWLLLLLLTLATSPLTVRVTSNDGILRSRESIADSFVLLAVMLYAVAPLNSAGPAVLLAALVGFVSTYRIATGREVILKTGMAVVSTFVAASFYGALVELFAAEGELATQGALPLNVFLVPLLVLAALQYGMSTIATAWFLSFEAGKFTLIPTQETIVWTLTTKLAGAASAVLFYAAVLNKSLAYGVLGLLISALVYLLYRFNERRLEEIRRAEAEQRRHVEEMATIHMNTIESLAIAIDAKDQTTHGHVRRTQIYATQMGTLFNVSEQEVRALHAGALLHDIGKLAVPEYILNKPGKLTEAEFAKMKIHPTVGGDILKRVNFPYPVEDIVRYHHEKWDGSGYPKGLKAEAIPLVARIISVVDFYDATRCDRPYRKGMKREESLALLRSMVGSAFDPKVVQTFIEHVEEFDRLIGQHDIQEQVASASAFDNETLTKPDAGLASDILGVVEEESSGFRSISEAQREVFALHEIAQTIGSSLNLSDTVTLVANKLRAIVPFDTCVIYLVNDRSGKAIAAHVVGEEVELFTRRRINIGDGITGWVIANARSMCNASPDLDMIGIPDEAVKRFRGVLVSPLLREDGAFGAIALYSQSRTSYTTEHVRLLESVCQHAASALNNALTYEKTRESALVDPLTELPNARGFYMMLEQRLAECQRMNKEPLSVVCMDIDDFKVVNDKYGHSIGDRLLASVAGVVRRELRQMDILTRYAGDEFVAIMPMASSKMAGSISERMRNAVEEQLFSVRDGQMVGLGISVGVACFPDDGETTEELLTTAARRMQTEKNGRKTLLTVAGAGINSVDMMT